jgi:hypothetical protein
MRTKLITVVRQQALGGLALFVALGGTSYAVATGSIDSREIKNNSIRSGDIRNNNIRGADIRNNNIRSGDVRNGTLLEEDFAAGQLPQGHGPMGFATINGQAANGPATVLNFGGQQTATDPPGVTAERQFAGTYQVTFRANTDGYSNANTVDDIAIQATGENFSNASAQAVSATPNVVVIQVRLRTFNGNAPADEDFSVNFYTRP